LYNIIENKSREDLLKPCKDLHLKLNDQNKDKTKCDLNAIDLCNEIEIVRSLYFIKDSCPLEILTFINDNKLQDTLPNLWIALRIMMTIPVTTANCKRSFSKLKLIKTYLRSTMTEKRLINLALISIENDIVSKLDLNEAIQNFADLKSKKKKKK
jgi:hypothetical protein